MSQLKNMPLAGLAVILIIIALFIIALIMLFYVYTRYRHLMRMIDRYNERTLPFLYHLVTDYSSAYKRYGEDTNTPAIIDNAIGTKLGGLLFYERFLNNAVSLFVTLGLFGTFLGLSLSVSSLTELISYSNTSEWLSVLDSVGGGLMSALSGMGVAFYTSLVGVACSILLTVLRTVFNPQHARERLSTALELWLDHKIAPTLETDAVKDEYSMVNKVTEALNHVCDDISKTMSDSVSEINRIIDGGHSIVQSFNKSVNNFNEGTHDFAELDYNLRGTIERMDVSVRELVFAMKQCTRDIERKADR